MAACAARVWRCGCCWWARPCDLAGMVFIESLRSIDAIAPRLDLVADAWVKGMFVAAFFLSVSASFAGAQAPLMAAAEY